MWVGKTEEWRKNLKVIVNNFDKLVKFGSEKGG